MKTKVSPLPPELNSIEGLEPKPIRKKSMAQRIKKWIGILPNQEYLTDNLAKQ